VDKLYALRSKRLTIEEKVKELKRQEEEQKDALIRQMAEAKLESITGRKATVSVTKQTVPTVKDWSAFHQYIVKTGAFDLLEKRASRSGCQARWEEEVSIPGVDPTVVVNLSITKSSKEK
jgi:hypothetical protein